MATRFISAVYTSAGVKDVVPIDFHKTMTAPVALYVALTNTPTATVSIEATLDGLTWFSIPNGNALSASTAIKNDFPSLQIRLNITAYTAGNIQWWVLQGDGDA